MKKFLIFLVVVLLIGTVFVILKIKQPAVASITYKKSELAVPTLTEFIRYDSKKISFAYENKYELRSKGKESDLGGNWELVGNAGVMSHFVILLSPATSSDIEDISGIKMRRVKKLDYSEEKIRWKDTDGVLFKRKGDGYELVAAFLIKNYALTIAMTANSNDDKQLRAEYNKLVKSIQWKE